MPYTLQSNLVLHYSDLTHTVNSALIMREWQPDEIYNLGSQSRVAVSFESPENAADVDAIGALRVLEAIHILGLEKKLAFIKHPR
jgi:GDPmannose 4,6-dehydratase